MILISPLLTICTIVRLPNLQLFNLFKKELYLYMIAFGKNLLGCVSYTGIQPKVFKYFNIMFPSV